MSWLTNMVGGLFAWLVHRASGSAGSGTTRAAAFVRYEGAMGFGHLGWGFDVDLSNANVGAVENPLGDFTCPVDSMGFWASVTGAPVHVMNAKKYNDLRYVELCGDPVAAYTAVKWVARQPYTLLGRNCMDDVYDVLRSYGTQDLPLPRHDILPNEWFLQFRGATVPVATFVWTKEKATLRQRIGVAIAKALQLKPRRGDNPVIQIGTTCKAASPAPRYPHRKLNLSEQTAYKSNFAYLHGSGVSS